MRQKDDNEGYASKEERFFSYYIAELKEHGFILEAEYQPEPFTLCEESVIPTAGKPFKKFPKKVYTADWLLYWSPKARDLFFCDEKSNGKAAFFYAVEHKSWIDVKGASFRESPNKSDITFVERQAWIHQKHDVFVQDVLVSLNPKSVFEKTFVPKRAITEEVYKADRLNPDKQMHRKGESKIRFNFKTIEEFTA